MAANDRITPCLMFNGEAEDAAAFYAGLFEGSSITGVSRYGEGAPYPSGTAMVVEFTLAGRRYQALNAYAPQGGGREAISFSVGCADQQEVDRLWAALTANGGTEGRCGWCTDRYGFTWQVVPDGLGALLGDADPGRRARASAAMMKMNKLDLGVMRAAADAAGDAA